MFRFTAFFLFVCLGVFAHSPFANAQDRQPAKATKSSKSFQIGGELKQYHYTEPGFVDHTGLLYGIWGEWLWNSSLGNGRTMGDLATGELNYDGALCNSSGVCSPYQAKTNDIIAKMTTRLEYNINPNTILFSGVGFRYLSDKGDGVGFYQRTGTWLFLPIGANLKFDSSIGNIVFDLQYDFIFYGNMYSALSQASSAYGDLNHTQTGYGLTVSGGVDLENISVAGFYELWDLNESNTVVEPDGSAFIEPKNNSTAFGLKLGYKF